MDFYESEFGIKIEDIEIDELGQNLQLISNGLDLVKDMSIKRENDTSIQLKITHSSYNGICKEIEKNMDKLIKQTGCPICSSVLCAITRSLGTQVRIQKVDRKDNEISFRLGIGG